MTNYAGQDFVPSGFDRIGELTRAWEGYRAHEQPVPPEVINELVVLAHEGSWLAGNMLHLQGAEWDSRVGEQQFVYGSATFHIPEIGQLELRYEQFSHDISEA
jgi:hypothetical protein